MLNKKLQLAILLALILTIPLLTLGQNKPEIPAKPGDTVIVEGQDGGKAEAKATCGGPDIWKTNEKDDNDWNSKPSIIVRSAIRPVPGLVLDSLHRKEPFYVEVRVPQDQAAKIGPTLKVNLRATKTSDTTSLTLEKHRGRGYIFYDHALPVQLRPEGAVDTLLQRDTSFEGMAPLNVEKDDTVTVSCDACGGV